MAHNILAPNDPNLNLLGPQELQIYGCYTFKEIDSHFVELNQQLNIAIRIYQNNSARAVVSWIHNAAANGIDFSILSTDTYTNAAIRDFLVSIALPCIEVYLSNICRCATFQRHSYTSDIAVGVICSLGNFGYEAVL